MLWHEILKSGVCLVLGCKTRVQKNDCHSESNTCNFLRIWGVNLGSVMSWNGSWREMFLKRAHLSYNGTSIIIVRIS